MQGRRDSMDAGRTVSNGMVCPGKGSPDLLTVWRGNKRKAVGKKQRADF